MAFSNRRRSSRLESTQGRRSQARRSRAIFEALEIRRLLSGYTFTLASQGSGTANGTYLQGLLNGTTLITGDGVTNHTVMLGDTLILPATYDYDMGVQKLELPNLGAAATVTVTSGKVNTTGWTMTYEGGIGIGGYTAAPTVALLGGGGSGAAATAIYNSSTGLITGLSITNQGSGYTSAPQVAFEGGAGILTIKSSDVGSLPAGRFTPTTATVADLARISTSGTDGAVGTDDPIVEDAEGHLGAPQNYTFDGIEICADADTDSSGAAYVGIGDPSSDQNYVPLVANNFVFNQDYIHGGAPGETSDDLTPNGLNTNNSGGIELNANYVTVENSQISDIHAVGAETHGIGGYNLLGNFTINNNYIDGGSEDILFGGAENYLPDPAQANNIAITNNYITKDPAWNPNLPQFAGVGMDVKNDIEFKTGTNITVSHNLIENVWVGADQKGEAISCDNIDSHSNDVDTWYDDAYITITDNVFRNVGEVIGIGSGAGPGAYQGVGEDGGSTEYTHDIIFSNNLAYDVGGYQWSLDQTWWAIQITGGTIQNLTIENNTIIGTDSIAYVINNGNPASVANFVFENNVVDESVDGFWSTSSNPNNTLNSARFEALTVLNPGSGYTTGTAGASFPVTISGGGGSGAAATAYVWPTIGAGGVPLPLAGQIMYIEVTNPGSGYTSAPTVTISGGGGSGATAAAMFPADNGGIYSYDFQNNVIIGGTASNYPQGGPGDVVNYFPASENAVEMLDPAGDEYGILPSTTYSSDGTGGSTPGVSMTTLLATNSAGVIPWKPGDVSNSLQNYYKFDEGSGTTAHDNGLGTHENGTLNGTYTWNTTGPQGGGITFSSSSNGYASVANFTVDPSFTFAAWINPTTTSGTQYIASTANSAFSLYLSGGVLTATGSTGTVTGSTLTAGKWSLVSATFGGGTLTLYVNGAEVGSGSATTVTTPTNTTFYIGDSKGTGSSFNGTLDEVRYYSASLAQTMSVIGDNNLGLAGGGVYTNTAGFAVSFTGGGGSGAAATAYAQNTAGVITSIMMTNSGSGYTAAPTMSFAAGANGTNGTGALDTAAMSVTPLSYLYAEYGPQFEETYDSKESNVVKSTTTTLYTAALTPDETYSAATYAWSVVTWPAFANVGKPSVGSGENPIINFSGPGYYLFQCVVTNSMGQSATLDYPMTVLPLASTNVAFVNPASVTLAENATKQFNVNGTSIANLGNTITDQFGNPMPSAEWSWSVYDSPAHGTITSAGLYTAPDVVEDLTGPVQLNYTTLDGLLYQESGAAVDITDANVPNAPASITITPGANHSNVISWTAPSGGGETGYYVFADTNPPYDGSIIDTDTNTSTLSFTDASESPGTAVYYYVEAYNANGGGANTAELGIVTGAPIAPSNLVATGGFTNSISLTWTNPATNASGVEVWRSTDETNWAQVANLSGTATSWTDNAANDPLNGAPVDGTIYYYYVQTYNTYTSLASDTSSATPIGPPTGLTATAIASNQISVSWVDPSTVPSYYLQYENANGGSWTTSTIAAGDSSFLMTSGLSADTQYNFEIEAYDAAGNSGYSSPVSARTWNAAATPTVYDGFNYPLGSSKNLIGQSGGIGWSGAWGTVAGDSGGAVYDIANGSQSVTPTSAYSGSTNAANYLLETGNSFYSSDNGGGLRTLATAIPNTSGTTVWASVLVNDQSTTAGGYVALIGSGGSYNVAFGLNGGDLSMQALTWNGWGTTAPVEGNTYLLVLEIQYDTSGSDSTMTMYVDPDPTKASSSWTVYESATVPNLNNISSIEINGTNWGPTNANYWDELRLGSTAASVVPTTLPSTPTGLTATPGTSSISLSWNSASSSTSFVQGYDVWRSTNGGVSYGSAPYATVGSSTLSYTDSSVTSGTTYYYEVTAENATGDSIDSAAVSAAPNGKPPTPTGLAATPGTNSITLTWNSDTGQTSYTIQRSTDDSTWSNLVTGVSSSATSYTDTTPTAGMTYYYQIEAVNSAGDSGFDTIGLTGGAATVNAYEDFHYATSSTWTGANTTGIGFTGNWTVSNSNSASIVSGLTYSSGTSALTTSGNALKLVASDTATQTLNQSVGAAGTTLWVSFEINPGETGNASVQIGSGTVTGSVAFGYANADVVLPTVITTTGKEYQPSAGDVTVGTTSFIVGEIQYLATSPVITIWNDPTPNSVNGATPTGYTAKDSITIPSTAGTITSTSYFDIYCGDGSATFDEIRLGSTYASVAPDPLVTGGNSSNKSSHRLSRATPSGHRSTPFLAIASTKSNSSDVVTKVKKTSAPSSYFYSTLDGSVWRWNTDSEDNLLLNPASDSLGSWHGLFN